MSYVITDGTRYCHRTRTRAVEIVNDLDSATRFSSRDMAENILQRATKKLNGFHLMELSGTEGRSSAGNKKGQKETHESGREQAGENARVEEKKQGGERSQAEEKKQGGERSQVEEKKQGGERSHTEEKNKTGESTEAAEKKQAGENTKSRGKKGRQKKISADEKTQAAGKDAKQDPEGQVSENRPSEKTESASKPRGRRGRQSGRTNAGEKTVQETAGSEKAQIVPGIEKPGTDGSSQEASAVKERGAAAVNAAAAAKEAESAKEDAPMQETKAKAAATVLPPSFRMEVHHAAGPVLSKEKREQGAKETGSALKSSGSIAGETGSQAKASESVSGETGSQAKASESVSGETGSQAKAQDSRAGENGSEAKVSDRASGEAAAETSSGRRNGRNRRGSRRGGRTQSTEESVENRKTEEEARPEEGLKTEKLQGEDTSPKPEKAASPIIPSFTVQTHHVSENAVAKPVIRTEETKGDSGRTGTAREMEAVETRQGRNASGISRGSGRPSYAASPDQADTGKGEAESGSTEIDYSPVRSSRGGRGRGGRGRGESAGTQAGTASSSAASSASSASSAGQKDGNSKKKSAETEAKTGETKGKRGSRSRSVSSTESRRRIFTQQERYQIYNRTEGHCGIRGRFIPLEEYTVDHIIPLSKGGTNDLENLQACCSFCNKAKDDSMGDDFFQRIENIFLYQTQLRYGKKKLKKLKRTLEEIRA